MGARCWRHIAWVCSVELGLQCIWLETVAEALGIRDTLRPSTTAAVPPHRQHTTSPSHSPTACTLSPSVFRLAFSCPMSLPPHGTPTRPGQGPAPRRSGPRPPPCRPRAAVAEGLTLFPAWQEPVPWRVLSPCLPRRQAESRVHARAASRLPGAQHPHHAGRSSRADALHSNTAAREMSAQHSPGRPADPRTRTLGTGSLRHSLT